MIISDYLNRILKQQPAVSDFLPKICRHLTPEIVNYIDDKIAFVIRLKGVPFEGVDDNQAYAQFEQYKNLLSSLGKSNGADFAIWTTLKRRRTYIPKDYQFKDIFAQQFADKYTDKFNNSKYFKNSFYITAILKYKELDDGLSDMEEIKQSLLNGLSDYEPVVLSCYQNENGVIFSGKWAYGSTSYNKNRCYYGLFKGNSGQLCCIKSDLEKALTTNNSGNPVIPSNVNPLTPSATVSGQAVFITPARSTLSTQIAQAQVVENSVPVLMENAFLALKTQYAADDDSPSAVTLGGKTYITNGRWYILDE